MAQKMQETVQDEEGQLLDQGVAARAGLSPGRVHADVNVAERGGTADPSAGAGIVERDDVGGTRVPQEPPVQPADVAVGNERDAYLPAAGGGAEAQNADELDREGAEAPP